MKNLTILSIIFFLTALTLAKPTYKEALTAYNNKEYKKSKIILNELLVLTPKDTQAMLLRSRIFLIEKKYMDAYKDVSLAYYYYPENENILKVKTYFFYTNYVVFSSQSISIERKDSILTDYYNTMEFYINSSIATADEKAKLLLEVGQIYSRRFQEDKGISLMKRSLNYLPENSKVYNNIAVSYLQKNNYDSSLFFFVKQNEIDRLDMNYRYLFQSLEKAKDIKLKCRASKIFQDTMNKITTTNNNEEAYKKLTELINETRKKCQ
ncbi:MAG TPA: hypothetical protein VK766_07140 [Cytophagaceae bacterium]|jgi:tetratricopeptide (TPR) repeat protein|nr:hypothetical protein [Cytophagaceae bacterium]